MSATIRPEARDLIAGLAGGWAATCALFLAYTSIPAFGIIAGFCTPFPAIYVGLKYGIRPGILVTVLTLATITAAGSLATAILYIIQCGMPAVLLPVFLSRGTGSARSLALTVIVQGLIVAGGAISYSVLMDVDINAQVVQGIAASVADTAALYKKAGLSTAEQTSFAQGLQQVGHLMVRLYPALLVLGAMAVSGMNLLLLKHFSTRLPKVTVGSFSAFRVPDWLIWFVITAGFALLIPDDSLNRVALNMLVVFLTVYFIQGLAIVGHFFASHHLPVILRWLFYALLGLLPYLVVAVTVLGLFDLWGNFRVPRIPKNL